MPAYTVKRLDESTWTEFSRLVERHNGVWGGCWCMGFHPEFTEPGRTAERNKTQKQTRVREGKEHSAIVFDGETAVGWCLFGPTHDLPWIKHRKQYNETLDDLPDWRITCFFVDREYRHKGVVTAALSGALEEIARLGGGTVESYPEDVAGRKVSGSFLYNSTVSTFEKQGFVRIRPLGKNHWVMRKAVSPAPDT